MLLRSYLEILVLLLQGGLLCCPILEILCVTPPWRLAVLLLPVGLMFYYYLEAGCVGICGLAVLLQS